MKQNKGVGNRFSVTPRERAAPLMSEFKSWLDEQLATLRPKHELRGAVTYMTSRWDSFVRFLESGLIPIDNNASERAVKNPVATCSIPLFRLHAPGMPEVLCT